MTAPGAHGEGEGVVVWRYPNCGQWLSAPAIPADVNRHPSNVNYTFPYRARPLGADDALLARLREAEARANTATVAADLMRARAEKAERERDEAVGMLKEARGALEFYATGRRNAFRCASESIDLTKGTGPCCERVIDAGGIAQDALSRIDALTKARG